MHRTSALIAALLLAGCEKPPPPAPPPTPAQKAAADRAECQALATQQSGFDPLTAEEPPRTVSSTHRRGGSGADVAGGAVEGAAKGAVLGVVGGAIMGSPGRGAGAGAAIGGLMGGAKRYEKSNEMVTTTQTNPAWEQYSGQKRAFKSAFDACLAQRAAAPPTAGAAQ